MAIATCPDQGRVTTLPREMKTKKEMIVYRVSEIKIGRVIVKEISHSPHISNLSGLMERIQRCHIRKLPLPYRRCVPWKDILPLFLRFQSSLQPEDSSAEEMEEYFDLSIGQRHDLDGSKFVSYQVGSRGDVWIPGFLTQGR